LRLRLASFLLLTLAYAVVSVAPCQPVFDEADAGLPFAASAERIAAWDAARANQPGASIAAACPCGCEQKSPVRSGGGAGFALLRTTPERAFAPSGFEVAFASPFAPAAPSHGIDPVPI
jgi:hypothetical protein